MTILRALYDRYERLAARGDLPGVAYSIERIAHVITLDLDGVVVGITPWQAPDGKGKMRPRTMTVPRSFKRPGTIPKAFFLWDNSKYVLGVGLDDKTKSQATLPHHLVAFHELHQTLLANTEDPGLLAFKRFVDDWTPERFNLPPFKPDMLEANFAFMLQGDVGDDGRPRFLHDRPEARRIWERYDVPAEDAANAMCLVTGDVGPIAGVHPAIKGVMDGQSSGVSIVSFNKGAFTSYGKDQGGNAPVTHKVALGYGLALNGLLASDSRNRVQIADATTVFWAEPAASASQEDIDWQEELAGAVFEPPPDPTAEEEADLLKRTEAVNTRRLRDTLAELAKGRPMAEIDPRLDPNTRFLVLGLAPNISRLSVRYWLDTTFGAFTANFAQHWADTRIKPWPWNNFQPSIETLLEEIALMRKFENIPNNLTGELMRAVLSGGRYPRTLLVAVIGRMRADQEVTGRRAAICRAVLVRDLRVDNKFPSRLTSDQQKKEYLVSLDRDEKNPGYRLGRLFAVLEGAQRAALGKINATIRDRYYGAASATPAAVFPILMRTSTHHLSVLRKGDKGGLSIWFDKEIADILGELGTVFPKSLKIEDQGRFAIGYYHQRAAGKTKGDDDAADQNPDQNAAENVED
ncbi:MAG TPA: type I-C CRISPR-associated protein Cas8c/Csd1 [Azospirillaceae bacterium]|nr:type I-C CRISPR-associated protein Cas8c/Csd1 [Azospirillaceae bacterium]HRQ80395.1 type I-C CRISPR-associated protein Cas8c/Csd1 [Azospirillaceae bacterium]